jgi:hypothetical protein
MRPRAIHLLACLAALTLAAPACSKSDEPSPSAVAIAPAPPMDLPAQAQAQAPGAPATPALGQRAMRITVETTLVVDDLDAALKKLRAAIEEHGGYVSDARVQGSAGASSAALEARIPSAKLPAFRAAAAALGEVAADAEKAEDVTEQRADIGARLRNARAQEKRLLDLLADKTGSLADVVAVEKELAQVRETIERIEAQERLLEGQIAYATVKLSITTRYEPPPTSAGSRIARAAKEGIENAGGFLIGLVVFLAAAGPTLLILAAIGAALYYAFRGVVRRRRAAGFAGAVHFAPPPPAPAPPAGKAGDPEREP